MPQKEQVKVSLANKVRAKNSQVKVAPLDQKSASAAMLVVAVTAVHKYLVCGSGSDAHYPCAYMKKFLVLCILVCAQAVIGAYPYYPAAIPDYRPYHVIVYPQAIEYEYAPIPSQRQPITRGNATFMPTSKGLESWP